MAPTTKKDPHADLRALYATKPIEVQRRLPAPGQEHLPVKHLTMLVGQATVDLALAGPAADFIVSQWMLQGGYEIKQVFYIGLDQPAGMWLLYVLVQK